MAAPPVRCLVRLIDSLPQNSDTLLLRFAAELHFHPGQALKVQVPGEPKGRYFSICSSPTEKGQMAVAVKAGSGSNFKTALERLKSGDSVEVEGPYGSFGLPAQLDMPLCFVAAGTGVTPFRSMSRYLKDQLWPVETWLLHSARTSSELLFRDEFAAWQKESPTRFHYAPTVTKSDADWLHDTGRIRQELIEKHIPLRPCVFLLCGPPAFVGDMEKLLTGPLNIPSEHVRREQW